MGEFASLLAAGVAQGAIASLIALGIVLLHKTTGIVNFAQGDLLTLGAYLGVFLVVDHHVPWVPAYLLTLAVAFVVGMLIERVGYAPLRRQPIITVIISTFALALGLRALLVVWRGQDAQSLPAPVGAGVWHVLGAAIPYQNALIVGVTAVVCAVLVVVLHRSTVGRQVRALAADRETALLQGIRVSRLSALMFGLSAALAALGGLLVAPTLSVSTELGFGLLLSSFAACVLGGFDRIGATVAAAFTVSVAQQLAAGYVSPDYVEAYPFLILLVALVIRPRGLFGEAIGVRY
jgi:branched-chain amino acid transport system permease protein